MRGFEHKNGSSYKSANGFLEELAIAVGGDYQFKKKLDESNMEVTSEKYHGKKIVVRIVGQGEYYFVGGDTLKPKGQGVRISPTQNDRFLGLASQLVQKEKYPVSAHGFK